MLSRLVPWLLVISSTSALAGLVLTTPPSRLTRVIFLALLFVDCFGLMLLGLRAYYDRHLSEVARRRDPQRPTREGLMIAGFVTLCAWLQMLRTLTLINALLLLGVLAFVEAFWISHVEQ